MPGHVTYIRGASGRETFDLYGQVRCRSICPGLDLIYHGNQQRLEYEFQIAAGAPAGSIALGLKKLLRCFDPIDQAVYVNVH